MQLRFFRNGLLTLLRRSWGEEAFLAGRGNKAELVAQLTAENLSKGGNRVDSVASSVDGPDPRLVEEEPSAETVERELCRSTGLPWPHIDYASREDMTRGINYGRVPSGWRSTTSIRAIEHRLSTDLCLDDFPGYVLERSEVNYRRKPPSPAASDLDPLSDAFPRRRCPKPRVRNRRKDNRGDFRWGGSRSESPPDRSARVDTHPNSDGYRDPYDNRSVRSGFWFR